MVHLLNGSIKRIHINMYDLSIRLRIHRGKTTKLS
jgi:hypothetical protein